MSVVSASPETLVIQTYQGSRIFFVLVPTAGDLPISDLATYTQISFSVYAGSQDSPGAVVLPLTYEGAGPNYITVVDVSDPSVPDGSKGIQIDVPASASKVFVPGQYFAELWLTPPGGDPIFTGLALWNHSPTAGN